jgi:RNA polymerase sigma-70 factor (ECF subfamily)
VDRRDFIGKFATVERSVRAYLHASCRNFSDAEDLLQNVWRTVWDKLDSYDDTRPFEAWVIGIARMEALKWRERQAGNRIVLSEDIVSRLAKTAAEESEDLPARHKFMMECLEQLQGAARKLVNLKYFERKKIREIAGNLQRNVSAIEMQLVRVRRLLRDCIERKMTMAESRQ